MDGRHVEIIAPPHSGTTFYNYKQKFSDALFGVVDTNYKFVYENVGIQGRTPMEGSSNIHHCMKNF
jgi:hypothetical protein